MHLRNLVCPETVSLLLGCQCASLGVVLPAGILCLSGQVGQRIWPSIAGFGQLLQRPRDLAIRLRSLALFLWHSLRSGLLFLVRSYSRRCWNWCSRLQISCFDWLRFGFGFRRGPWHGGSLAWLRLVGSAFGFVLFVLPLRGSRVYRKVCLLGLVFLVDLCKHVQYCLVSDVICQGSCRIQSIWQRSVRCDQSR